jgi:hypothetical protein
MKKIILGAVESVEIGGKKFRARIDTGAQTSSIDKRLAEKLHLNNVVKIVQVRSANGKSIRKVVKANIKLSGKSMGTRFTVANREKMNYKVLIGRNVLKNGFVVDCSK